MRRPIWAYTLTEHWLFRLKWCSTRLDLAIALVCNIFFFAVHCKVLINVCKKKIYKNVLGIPMH